jgi:hypothetical protein
MVYCFEGFAVNVNLNRVETRAEIAWCALLKLTCEALLSSFAFGLNLCRYVKEKEAAAANPIKEDARELKPMVEKSSTV